MTRQEGDEVVDADDDLLGHAEIGEAVVRVIDAAGGREVRLETPEFDLEGLVEEGSVVPRGDAQDVGIVRGRGNFIDVGERVHEPTQIVHLAFRRAPALCEVDALVFEVRLARGCADLLHGVDEGRQQPLRCLSTHGPLSLLRNTRAMLVRF